MKKKLRWWRGCWVAGLCLVGIYCLLRVVEYKRVYTASRRMDAAPGKLGRPFEDVFIPVKHGERIEVWYFPAKNTSSPVAVVCHGSDGNISDCLDICSLLLDAGTGVLLFDYRGYGRSEGSPSEEGTYRDAQAAYQWLRQKGFAGTNIIAFGESLGGGVAAELAARETVGGLVLQSTFTSIPDMGADLFPWLPVRWLGTIHYDTRSKLPRLKVPVLVMHSPADELVRFNHGQRNFAAANEPKLFWELKGDHNNPLADTQRFIAGLEKFLSLLKGA